MTPHAVYNVIVSAILKPGSIPASLVALAMQGAVQLFVTREILAEYQEVLKRPAFGFEAATVETFLSELENAAVTVYPQVTSAQDEADNRFLECAEEARAQFVVTGNKKDFPFAEYGGAKIVSPAEFAALLIEE
jgi:putative PIN family toxin of toxin-antitoxin system